MSINSSGLNIAIIEKTPKDKKWLKKMYHFQHDLYKKEPHFVPHLKMESIGGFGQKGMLEHGNPFHKKADVVYFIALHKKKIVGTVAAIINHFHNEYHNESIGFFGCFEVIKDYQIAKALLDKASGWVKERGATKIRGPFNLDINGESGLLVDSFDRDNVFQTPYHFPYYKDFLTQYGLEKVKDLYAQLMPITIPDAKAQERRNKRIHTVMDFVQKKFPQIRVESFNFKKPEKHLQDMKTIYMESWKDNWGFVPILDEEFASLAEGLKMIANPNFVMIAYIDDKPASFIVIIPDINIELKKRKWLPQIFNLLIAIFKIKFHKIKRLRLILFGVMSEYRKLGLDSWFFAKTLDYAIKNRYEECELSWLLEDNTPVLRAGEKMGASIYRTWRIFEKNL